METKYVPLFEQWLYEAKDNTKTVTWKVLEFIKSKGKEGASLKEIQLFIWVETGHDEDDFYTKVRGENQRKTRGHWNTQLLGGMHYHEGILHKYCEKNDKGKWVLVKMPKKDENLYNWG